MKTRILSGFLMLPLLIVVWLGGAPLFFACLAISAGGMYEFYKGFRAMGRHPSAWTGYVALAFLYAILLLEGAGGLCAPLLCADDRAVHVWLSAVLAAGLCVSLFKKDHDVFDGPLGVLGVLYIGFFCSHIVLIEQRWGSAVWLVFLTAFGTDIMAYFTGYCFGKHKLCPNLSPKKTIEGAVGGVLGSILFCVVYALLCAPERTLLYAVCGLLASPFAQAGDLVASAFKRKMGIKDYGKLIPGHGGIMDRIDSILFTAPFIYYFMHFAA